MAAPPYIDRGVPFVGREAELDAVCAPLRAGSRGPAAVLLSGEPGIGKTRLLAELAARAVAVGWRVLAGRAQESEGAPPYLPLIEALHDTICSRSRRELLAILGADADLVARAFPDLRERLQPMPQSYALPAEHERYRLFEAVRRLVVALASAERRGLLLVLDDLHWADTTTLLLLRHLLERAGASPLLLAAACRTDALEPALPLGVLSADLTRAGLLAQVTLGGLPPDACERLIAALHPAPVAPATAAAIAHAAAGNPFFVRQLVQHLQASGHDFANSRRAECAGAAVPDGARRVIEQRLAQLSADARGLLQAAAVLDGDCTFETARRVRGIDEPRLLDALDEALHAGLLRDEGVALRFSHALIRRTVYAGLSLQRQQRLHLRAAEALETAGPQPQPAAALAMHYRLAGTLAPPGAALRCSLQAGEAAASAFAWEEAAAHWEAALSLMHEGNDRSPADRAGVLERLGEVLYLLGRDVERALHCLEEALSLYEALGLAERAAAVHVRLGHTLMLWTAHEAVDIPRALGHFRAAEAWMVGRPESPLLGDLYTGFAMAALKALHTREGLAVSQRAVAIGERLCDQRVRVDGAILLGIHLVHSGRLAAGLALLDEAWAVADAADEVLAAYLAVAWRVKFDLLAPGDLLGGRRRLERELGKARLSRMHGLRENLLSDLSLNLLLAGTPPDEVDRITGAHGARDAGAAGTQLFAGDWRAAIAGWEAVLARYAAAGDRFHLWSSAWWLGWSQFLSGEFVQAHTSLLAALAAIGDVAVPVELAVRPLLALIDVELGQIEDARLQVHRCEAILSAGEDWRAASGRVALAGAVVAAAGGGRAEADAGFARSLTSFAAHGQPWEMAEAWLQWGRSLRAAGAAAAAQEKFDAAAAVYLAHHAAPRWLERVAAARHAAVSGGPHSGVARTAPARVDRGDLSPREVEVLGLIAAGQTNQQIARSLVLSVRTVERHIGSIYEKLGVQGPIARAAATAYALRHGIGDSP